MRGEHSFKTILVFLHLFVFFAWHVRNSRTDEQTDGQDAYCGLLGQPQNIMRQCSITHAVYATSYTNVTKLTNARQIFSLCSNSSFILHCLSTAHQLRQPFLLYKRYPVNREILNPYNYRMPMPSYSYHKFIQSVSNVAE